MMSLGIKSSATEGIGTENFFQGFGTSLLRLVARFCFSHLIDYHERIRPMASRGLDLSSEIKFVAVSSTLDLS